MDDGPEWRFRGQAVLGEFEAIHLPGWLGGHVISRGWARGRARRAVARAHAAVTGGDPTERGLTAAFATDPRRDATAEPFIEETETGVRCGYEFTFAVALNPDSMQATWPTPGADSKTVETALADRVREELVGTADSDDRFPEVTVRRAKAWVNTDG
jgi:hypothetical protein